MRKSEAIAVGLLSVFGTLLSTAWGQPQPFASSQSPKSLEIEITAGRFVGMPVRWTSGEGILLERSGKFQIFAMPELASHRILAETFYPLSLPEARSRLVAELGEGFETAIAGPYVIAAPTGESHRWQQRFMTLLAGYLRYFEVRGWTTRKPDFPLSVVVFPDRAAFRRSAASEFRSLPENTVGSYFPMSNRCMLYQLPGENGIDWSETEATIVHEAVHQLAYNTGVHERLFKNPLWLVEGLATMFEVRAVYDPQALHGSISDRIHRDMQTTLKPLFVDGGPLEACVERLLNDDELFRREPNLAYALAWGMNFTLAERMPREYGEYLQLLRNRGLGSYTPEQRMADFRTAFQINPQMLAHQMRRLLAE